MPAPTAKLPTCTHIFTGRDLPWLVETQAQRMPDKTFLVWEPFGAERRSWTYAAFAEEVAAFSTGFAAQGIVQGDFVIIHMDNRPEFLFAWYALSRLGAVAVTTNTRSSEEELRYFIEHSGSSAAITEPRYVSVLKAAGPNLRWIACTEADADSDVRDCDPTLPFQSLRGEPRQAPRRPPDPLAPNSVQYTSGTTSRPKGVVWTHANALWSARTNAIHTKLTDGDVHLVYFPLFHTNALAYSVLATLWSGGTVVLMPRFSASRFWDIAVRNGCTWANHVMFTLGSLEHQPAPENHAFRLWTFGHPLDSVRQRWGIGMTGWWGMTETVSQGTVTERDWPTPAGTMGYPASEYEIRVTDESGDEVALGETGKLWIRGVAGLSMFLEYLHDPKATAEAFDAEGWFDTGDLVTTREDGYLFFAGREKDMLKVGGENVAASEIEAVIIAIPGVREVAVVGKPDAMLDEVPAAFVVRAQSEPSEAVILERCREALADFKVPRDVRFVETLPKGLMDKVLKKELRERLRS